MNTLWTPGRQPGCQSAPQSYNRQQTAAVMKRAPLALFLPLLFAGLSACADAGTSEMPPPLENPLISVDELDSRMGEPRLVVIDARPTAEFLGGHIPGAISASFSEEQSTSNGEPVSYGGGIDFFVDNERSIPFQDGGRAQIEAAVRAFGINNDSQVVVYDAGSHFHAPRFAYTLEKHGFRNLRVLNGGLRAWTDAGGQTVTEIKTVQPGNFTARPADSRLIATTDDVLAAAGDPHTTVVSSLGPDWHFGQYLAYSQPGHIPHAISVPMTYFFGADGMWRSPAQIRALLEVSGIGPDDKIITYCGGNPLSTCNYFTLRHVLGHKNVRVYEEALVGWLADKRDLEVHTWQHPEMLRDSDWVHWYAGERIQRLLLDAPAQVVDVRSREDYDAGHIPWSIHVDVSDLMATTPEAWATTLGASGLSTDREIVVCGDEITPSVTSLFWLLEYLGHRAVSVCADGIDGWSARGYSLTTKPTEVREAEHWLDVGIHPAEFALDIQGDRALRTIDGAAMHAAFPRRWVVASADIPEHATDLGRVSHLPWPQLFSSGRTRGAAATWGLMEDANMTYFEELVVTADTWEEATPVYFALRLLGAPMVRVYVPGSVAL